MAATVERENEEGETEARNGERHDEEEKEERETEVPAAPGAAFSGEPLNRVVFAEESWDHPK